LPKSLKNNKIDKPTDFNLDDQVESNKTNKKYIIILGIAILIGVGVWYFYFSNSGSTGSDTSSNNTPIVITDNQTTARDLYQNAIE
jgi:flagellar basal body-associated protein FliL